MSRIVRTTDECEYVVENLWKTQKEKEDMQQSLNQQDMEELWVFKETMRYLRVSRSTLLRLIASGVVPAHKIGNAWRFYPSEVRASVKRPVRAEQGEEA